MLINGTVGAFGSTIWNKEKESLNKQLFQIYDVTRKRFTNNYEVEEVD